MDGYVMIYRRAIVSTYEGNDKEVCLIILMYLSDGQWRQDLREEDFLFSSSSEEDLLKCSSGFLSSGSTLKWAIPGLILISFWSFSNKHYKFNVKNVHPVLRFYLQNVSLIL